MKNKRFALTRVVAGVTVTALLAACSGGSESSDTTERTRNSALWTATTVPTKVVVYGTQDGLIEYVQVPSESGPVTPTNVATVEPYASVSRNAVVSVGVDTARSELIFGGYNKSGKTYISKINTDGSSESLIFEDASNATYGMGYDPISRVTAINYIKSGNIYYVVHSADDVMSPLVDSNVGYFNIPLISNIATNSLVTTGSVIRRVDLSDPRTILGESAPLSTTPYDMWGIAKNVTTDDIYVARQGSGELFTTQANASAPLTSLRTVTNPASLAVFSDGTIAVGTGSTATAQAPTIGALSVIDPTGTAADINLSGVGSGKSASGLQSVWAVESPIAETAAAIDGDTSFGSTLNCQDATWRGDLPLSRLSRSPIEGVRTYSWFLNGTQIEGETSDTYVSAAYGSYQCAVTAGNLAGIGQSEMSEPLVIPEDSTPEETTTTIDGSGPGETTSTTIEGSGGSEAAPVVSPIVTVPVAAPATPVVVVTPSLRSAKWTFKGRTAKVTFRTYPGAKKYRLYISGATKKTVVCKSAKTTVTCTMTTLKKGINSFSAKALSTSGVTLALSTKSRLTK